MFKAFSSLSFFLFLSPSPPTSILPLVYITAPAQPPSHGHLGCGVLHNQPSPGEMQHVPVPWFGPWAHLSLAVRAASHGHPGAQVHTLRLISLLLNPGVGWGAGQKDGTWGWTDNSLLPETRYAFFGKCIHAVSNPPLLSQGYTIPLLPSKWHMLDFELRDPLKAHAASHSQGWPCL